MTTLRRKYSYLFLDIWNPELFFTVKVINAILSLEGTRFYCTDCLETFDKSENTMNNIDSEVLCEDCYNDNYSMCDCCGESCYNNSIHVVDRESYCESCYDEHFRACANCGISVNLDNVMFSERDDEYYCEDCYPGDEEDEHHLNLEFFKGTNNNYPIKKFWGVEVECENASHIGYDELKEYDIVNKVSCVYDGSLSNKGREFVTQPANKEQIHQMINRLCDCLKDNNAGVTSTTGLHIHYNAKNINQQQARKIWLLYDLFEEVLFNIVPPSRRMNQYCKRLSFNYINFFNMPLRNFLYGYRKIRLEHYDNARYFFINFHSYFYRKTIEIRLHGGTLNAKKILNWIRLNERLINIAINMPIKRLFTLKGTFKTFKNLLGDKELVRYVEERARTFKKKNSYRVVINEKTQLSQRLLTSLDESYRDSTTPYAIALNGGI